MSTQIQFRRGTATEHASFTGAVGEITVDTTDKRAVVHDGTTAGGSPLAKESEIPTLSTLGLATSSTDNAIVRFDGSSGHTQNSGVTISDANVVAGANVTATGGSVARTLESRAAKLLAVSDFGTDSTAAQSAITTAQSAGVPLWFDSASYTFGSSLTGDNVGFFGNQTTTVTNTIPGAVNGGFENPQALFWRQGVLNRTGSGSASSWNTWLDLSQATIPAITSTVSMQSAARLTMLKSSLASDYGGSIYRDATGDQVIVNLDGSTSLGRIWGRHTAVRIETGSDGTYIGHEIEGYNYGTTQTSVSTSTSKTLLGLAAAYGVTTTAQAFYNSGSAKFHRLIWSDASFINTGGYFIDWNGIGAWMPDGSIRVGTGSAPSAAAGVYVYDYAGSGLHVYRPTSGNATAKLEAQGAAATAYIQFSHSSSADWSVGIDNATNQFRIAYAAGFGSNNAVAIDPATLAISTLGDISLASGKKYKINGTQIAASDLSNGTTGSGAVVLASSPTLTTPALGTPSAIVLTNATGLPVASGISGLGTGVATALAVNVGSAGAFVTFNGALGTPSSGTLTNATGLPISSGVSGLATGVATFLATPSSSNLKSAVTDETGSGALVFADTPTLVTPNIGTATGTGLILTSTSANALAVGRQGSTNPALQIDASTATSATGLKVKAAAAAGGLALSVITSGTNENLTIDAAGSGTITIGGTSTGALTLTRATTLSAALTYGGVTLSNAVTGTGNMVLATSPTLTTPTIGAATATSVFCADGSSPSITNNGDASFNGVSAYGAYFRGKGSVYDVAFINSANNAALVVPTGTTDVYMVGSAYADNLQIVNYSHIYNATAIPAGGSAGKGYRFSSATNFGIFFGSSTPTLSAAKGSLYLRSDGSSSSTRAYINTDGSTTWTAITTAA